MTTVTVPANARLLIHMSAGITNPNVSNNTITFDLLIDGTSVYTGAPLVNPTMFIPASQIIPSIYGDVFRTAALTNATHTVDFKCTPTGGLNAVGQYVHFLIEVVTV